MLKNDTQMEMTVLEIDKQTFRNWKKFRKIWNFLEAVKCNDNDAAFLVADAPTFRHRFRPITVSP